MARAEHGLVVRARAPGRLDVMGGIADYSGSLVLQWPLREATRVSLQRTGDPGWRITSRLPDGTTRTCEVPLDAVAPSGVPVSYAAARGWFEADPARHWAAYVAGPLLVLARERGLRLSGARIDVESEVPEGKGVSSSAALEAASMMAALAAWDIELPALDAALLCQRAENLVVGAPCGVMDQVASICGEADRLTALLCQPAEIKGTVALPADWTVWGIDSGIRHAVTGADYGSVRTGAFMGYRILAAAAGLPAEPGAHEGHVRIRDTRWNGYLANVSPAELSSLARHLPDAMGGAEFLSRFGGITDPVTRVHPDRTYPVRLPTAHPIHEHARVQVWHAALVAVEAGHARADETLGQELGRLMYESHASYSACGLGSDGTDLLVQLAREAGPAAGIFGAKITGGGSGGTVAILGRREAARVVHGLAAGYERRTGRSARVFSGSSPGAAASGVRRG